MSSTPWKEDQVDTQKTSLGNARSALESTRPRKVSTSAQRDAFKRVRTTQ
jgi:hypothetical protein